MRRHGAMYISPASLMSPETLWLAKWGNGKHIEADVVYFRGRSALSAGLQLCLVRSGGHFVT